VGHGTSIGIRHGRVWAEMKTYSDNDKKLMLVTRGLTYISMYNYDLKMGKMSNEYYWDGIAEVLRSVAQVDKDAF